MHHIGQGESDRFVRRLPPLTAVEAFVQVARLGSVKAAAEELALSSPALSRRVQTLERFTGRALFERRHQAMILTSDGEQLLARLAPALDQLAEALDTTGETELLRLRLSVLPLFAAQRLMGHLPELRDANPELHIDIDTAAHGLARLGEGIDAAIVLSREVEPSLYSRRLDSHNKVCVIGARRLLDGPNPVRVPDDLRRMTVFLHRDMPEAFDVWKEAVGHDIEPAAVDHFDSGHLMLDAVAQGLGIAFMLESHYVDAHDDRLAAMFPIEVESPYSYWFACRRSSLGRRPVRIFHDWLFKTVARN
jgi:LysR family glycine cleavage system transcriptional activator